MSDLDDPEDRSFEREQGPSRRPGGPHRPWHARMRPSLVRTVGTFAAVGVGAGVLGAGGGLLLTRAGSGEYGDFVVAWVFGLVGVLAVAFAGLAIAAVAGVRTGQELTGPVAYATGAAGGFAGQVVMLAIAAGAIAPATDVHLGGGIALLTVLSGVPAAIAGCGGVLVGIRAPSQGDR